MRIFLCLMLGMLLQKEIFAQNGSAEVLNGARPSASVTNNIDQLNNSAYDLFLSSPDSARMIAENALLLAEQAKYTAGIGRSFFNIGKVYWSQSYYRIALFYLKKALENIPKEQHLLISDCYNALGRTYADLKNYNEALKFIDLAEQTAGGDASMLAAAMAERAFVYMRQQDFDQSDRLTRRALALDRSVKAAGDIAILYGRLGGIYTKKKDYPKALRHLDTALTMSLQTNNRRLRATIYVEYADIYNDQHKYDKAINYAKMGVALADSIGVVDALTGAYQQLIKSYRQQDNPKMALSWQRKFNSARDSLEAFNKTKNIQLIQNVFFLNKKLGEIDSIERNNLVITAKIHSKNTQIVTLTLSLFILIALLYVTFYLYKQKEMLSEQLNEQHEELLVQKQLIEAQAANLEEVATSKDKLLAIIGHDLRTPLANLSNIVQMFEMEYLSKGELQQLMKSTNLLVKGAELTLSNLVEWAGSGIRGHTVNAVPLDIYLLGVEIQQTFHHALQQKEITFSNNAALGRIVIADENHIKVVLRNLVSNAIKFTMNDGNVILTSRHLDNMLVICIEDTGSGMSEHEISRLFQLQTHFSKQGTMGEHGTGIGLLLCKELVELNGGKLWIDSSPGKGSRFYFSLPLVKAYA